LEDRNKLHQNYDWISKSHGGSKASSVNKKEWASVGTHCIQKVQLRGVDGAEPTGRLPMTLWMG
jgi:hypothetical protein